MEIKLRKQDEDTLEVVASGKIDIDSAVEYGTKISDAVEDNEIKNVILDFAQITYISSMGLNIFKMTGFSKFLNIV